MNKKERQQIYLDAVEFFDLPYENRNGKCGFCHYLTKINKGTMKYFDEFYLFHPPYNVGYFSYWFDYVDQTDRQLALLFAAEMCND